jgi:hypothetical protein
MVFNHGNSVTNEDHFGVPMIMASHGYFVVTPNHFDGTSIHAINDKGEEVWFCPAGGEEITQKNQQGKMESNDKFWDIAGKATLDCRVNALNKLAQELSAPDFCKNHIGADIALDTDRLISSGQSFGGITAIGAADGD